MPHVGSRDSHIATAPPPPPNATKFESRDGDGGSGLRSIFSRNHTYSKGHDKGHPMICNWKEFPNKLASDRLDVWLTHSDYIRLIIVRLPFEQCFDIVTLCHVTFQVIRPHSTLGKICKIWLKLASSAIATTKIKKKHIHFNTKSSGCHHVGFRVAELMSYLWRIQSQSSNLIVNCYSSLYFSSFQFSINQGIHPNIRQSIIPSI